MSSKSDQPKSAAAFVEREVAARNVSPVEARRARSARLHAFGFEQGIVAVAAEQKIDSAARAAPVRRSSASPTCDNTINTSPSGTCSRTVQPPPTARGTASRKRAPTDSLPGTA